MLMTSPQKGLPQPQTPHPAFSQRRSVTSSECTSLAAAPGWAWRACPYSRRHPFVILHFKVSFEVSRTMPRIETRCFIHMHFGGGSNTLVSPSRPTGTQKGHLPVALALGRREGGAGPASGSKQATLGDPGPEPRATRVHAKATFGSVCLLEVSFLLLYK